jgi:hypothetical protein
MKNPPTNPEAPINYRLFFSLFLVLTLLSVSVTLRAIISLIQPGSVMISAYAGRCGPKSDFFSINAFFSKLMWRSFSDI